jgi:hypothetical protein
VRFGLQNLTKPLRICIHSETLERRDKGKARVAAFFQRGAPIDILEVFVHILISGLGCIPAVFGPAACHRVVLSLGIEALPWARPVCCQILHRGKAS